MFYWLAVVATFAMGTALGDLTAVSFHLGYFASGILFAGIIAIPALGFRLLHWNAVFSFWFAYVATRPLGASFADWLGKPHSVGGLGLGDGPVALVLAFAIFLLVAFLAVTHRDVQRRTAQRGTAQRGTAQRGTAQRGTAQRGTAQRGTAQRGTAQRGTAQPSTAQPGPRHGAGPRVPAMESARPYPDERTMEYRRPRPEDRTPEYPRRPDDATIQYQRPDVSGGEPPRP